MLTIKFYNVAGQLQFTRTTCTCCTPLTCTVLWLCHSIVFLVSDVVIVVASISLITVITCKRWLHCIVWNACGDYFLLHLQYSGPSFVYLVPMLLFPVQVLDRWIIQISTVCVLLSYVKHCLLEMSVVFWSFYSYLLKSRY